MNHTTATPDSDGSTNEASKSVTLANPRRTRLGADGRPLGPVTTTSD